MVLAWLFTAESLFPQLVDSRLPRYKTAGEKTYINSVSYDANMRHVVRLIVATTEPVLARQV